METIHVKNLEKYHPGYKDRNLVWCKTYFTMLNADPEFEMLCEIDRWRFMALVMLELQIKKPIPNDTQYLKRKGFDIKKRAMSLTLQMLHTLVEVSNGSVTEDTTLPCPREEEDKEEEKKKNKSKKCVTEFVFLTDEEHQKLIEKFGEDGAKSRIEELSDAIGSKGYKYKSHYHTILNWDRRNNKNQPDSISAKLKRINEEEK